MPSTPILGITQVSTSQAGKETTINDAILALENAGNATLTASLAAGDVTLTATEATRNFIFVATGATMARNLKFPIAISGNPYNRIFAVRNESGYSLTVKFASGAGSTVVIPDGESRLISGAAGLDMTVAAEAPSVIAFLSLTDVPGSYTGEAGRFLAVNIAENALEFIDGAVFPAFTGEAGKHLIVNLTEDGVEWADPVTDFLSLTDTPNSYTGHANKLVSVKATEDGVEFIDTPDIEAVEFISAARWRIFVVEPGSEPEIGYGEVEFLDVDLIDLTGSGTASASNEDTGFEAAKAFDNDLTSGIGWLTEPTYIGDVWLEYDFGTPVSVRWFRLTPITTFPGYTPARARIEYYDGATWVALGDRIAATWVEATSQTFKVNGVPLTSVADAPSDGVPYVRRNADWEDGREWIRDIIGTALANGTAISITVNDGGDSITINTVLDTDGTLAANSDTVIPSQKAVKTYVDSAITGVLEYKGGINCSANPNYPAAVVGDVYVVTVAGKIGGASGPVVEVGDTLFAKAITASGDHATVGANWDILQYNTNIGYYAVLSFAATPTTGEVLLIHTFGEPVTFADEWVGAVSHVGTNPAASFVLTIYKNGVSVGTATISTGGAVTLTTTGGSVSFAAGDTMQIDGPATADTTIKNVCINFLGTRG